MAKRLLLISNSTNYGEEYMDYTKPYIKNFLGDTVKEVLFVPYAGVSISYDEYTAKVENVFNKLGYEIKSVHRAEDPVKAVEEAEAIAVGGGNTFHLVHMMHETGIMDAIRRKAEAGTPYMGWSAGSNAACPSLKTTNDMPIIQPRSFEALGLVSFQINPHYTDAIIPNHNGESREDRIREFLVANPDMIVVGLKEGTMLRIEDEDIEYIGTKTVKVFKSGAPTLEFDKNASLDFLR
ncbi:MAG: dipeptidase PepE [Bacteroidia bacterium]|nr:MAG: dipeptidase PepE [Bacteroidia bacterium]